MKYQLNIILFLAICSCDRQANRNPAVVKQHDTLQRDTINTQSTPFPTTTFTDRSLFSYNATSADKFGDTIYSCDIDIFLKSHPGDGTTFGDTRSYYHAIEKLDTLIEAVYRNIYQKLKSEQDKKLFKSSHENWKNYFSSEADFLHEIYYTKEADYGFGREHSITQAQWAFQIARQRLILLKNIDAQTYADEGLQ